MKCLLFFLEVCILGLRMAVSKFLPFLCLLYHNIDIVVPTSHNDILFLLWVNDGSLHDFSFKGQRFWFSSYSKMYSLHYIESKKEHKSCEKKEEITSQPKILGSYNVRACKLWDHVIVQYDSICLYDNYNYLYTTQARSAPRKNWHEPSFQTTARKRHISYWQFMKSV